MIKILGGYLSILSFEIVIENHLATELPEAFEKNSFSLCSLWHNITYYFTSRRRNNKNPNNLKPALSHKAPAKPM